jgi:hypothetical protein
MSSALDCLRGLLNEIKPWQTLIGATIALLAAGIAFHNTSRSLRQNKEQEANRRRRKHAAVRATLPLALAQISNYAAQSARNLDEFLREHPDGPLPPVPPRFIQSPPAEALATLSDFIEYSDAPLNVGIVEDMVASIQIYDSSLRELVARANDPRGPGIVIRHNLETAVINAAAIYAGTSTLFDYARRREQQLPLVVSWQTVRDALVVMHISIDRYEPLLTVRENRIEGGAFGRLRERHEAPTTEP